MRIFLYHKTRPDGKIFTDVAEFKQAIDDGWVDAPQEIGNKDYEVEGYDFPDPEPEEDTEPEDEPEPKTQVKPKGRPPKKGK
jgi:hypothetical protein